MGRRRSKHTRQSAGSGAPDVARQPQLDDDFLDAFLGVGSALESSPVEPVGMALRDIMPDPVQPRRAMPTELRDDWLSGDDIHDVLERWETQAHASAIDARMPLRWRHIIDQEDDPTPLSEKPSAKRGKEFPPITQLWLELVRLAGSIKQVGLEQPITVFPVNEEGNAYFQLIVGERRFLAYNLLNKLGYEGYTHIPAIKRQEAGVWRQAFENGARQDLNAIARSRQLALLLMALNPGQWEAFDETGQPDQEWYAQAADLRVPYGKAESIATVLGLKNPRQLRRYRALLTLPDLVWMLADEHGWAEGKLRAMFKAANGDSDQLVRIAKEEAGLITPPKRKRDPLAKSLEKAVATLDNLTMLKPDKDWTHSQREQLRRAIATARRRLDDIEQEL